MSVAVTMLGRLGNNLFQYALGRIVAEHLDFALDCSYHAHRMFRKIDCGPTATLVTHSDCFPNAPLHIPGRSFESPVERFQVDEDGWSGMVIDLPALLADPSPRHIKLIGYFQRFEYFSPYADQIRHWFSLKGIRTPYTLSPTDVVVNVRRGDDFKHFGWTLSTAYYDRVLPQLGNIGQVYVCGTGIDEDIRTHFKQYRPIYYDATPLEHFAFMQRFNRIVLSNSTFAWWAAFLSDATEVYAPRSCDGHVYGLTGSGDVDLHLRDDRYIEITVPDVSAPVPVPANLLS